MLEENYVYISLELLIPSLIIVGFLGLCPSSGFGSWICFHPWMRGETPTFAHNTIF
jgi:hypothetical protein